MEQNKQPSPKRSTARKKKKMSYRKKILYLQIGAITLAIFLALMLGSAALTKALIGKANNTQSAGSKKEPVSQQEPTQEPETLQPDVVEEGQESEGSESVQEPDGEDTSSSEEAANTEQEEQVVDTQITISFAGDCTLGQDSSFSKDNNFDAFYIVKKSYGYFLRNVSDIFAQDDLSIVNMEGTLTKSSSRSDRTYAFRGDPNYAQVLKEGNIEAVSFASDHSFDYGDQGYSDTITNLDAAGIAVFGGERIHVSQMNGIGIGLIAIDAVSNPDCQQTVINSVQSAMDQGAELIIVSFHWGELDATVPDANQQMLAHTAIDQGADLVIGHHSQTLQGIEVYNGKNIVYSLGSFIYGINKIPADTDTMIFQQTFSFSKGAITSANDTKIIPCSVSSELGYNSYQPIPLEGGEADRVLQKIQERSAAIGAQ